MFNLEFLSLFNEETIARGFLGMDVPSDFVLAGGCSEEVCSDYMIANLLKKNEALPVSPSLQRETMEKWFATEEKCKMYNEYFYMVFDDPLTRDILIDARHVCHKLLGRLDTEVGSATTGATTNTPNGADPVVRFTNPEMTEELFDSTERMFHDVPWINFSICRGSVTKLIPKTWKSLRVIQPEPACNAYYQRGVGLQIAASLNKTHLDLSLAKEKHMFLAEAASLGLVDLVTEDLTEASASVYTALVKWLVPNSWFSWMSTIRSSYTRVEALSDWPGQVPGYHKLQQFATMGNGFCFELETVVFYSLLVAVGMRHNVPHDQIHVFGDDLIYPSCMVPDVRRAFHRIGFDHNVQKSYVWGVFRESCGGDYTSGLDVRPPKIRTGLMTSYEKTQFANRILEKYKSTRYETFLDLWRRVIDWIPAEDRLWGPSHGGDNFLHCLDEDLLILHIRTRSKYDISRIKGWFLQAVDYSSVEPTPSNWDLVSRLAVKGFLRGYGDLVLTKKGRDGEEVSYRRYTSFPEPGTRYQVKRKWYVYSSKPNGVDENNPLSVFDILGKTACARHIYSRDYNGIVVKSRDAKLRQLCAVLHSIKALRDTHQNNDDKAHVLFLNRLKLTF